MSQPALLPYDPLCTVTTAAIFSLLPAPSQTTSKMTSGVKVADEVKDLYNEMKLVKNEDDENERLRVAIFEINDGFIKIERAIRQKDLSNVEDVFKFTMNLLDNKVCRYMLYDCHFETKEAIKKEELVFMMWAPEEAPIKQKMNYASSKESIKKVLTGKCFSLSLFCQIVVVVEAPDAIITSFVF
ncbi:hypothetical protein INR49_009730 [Caranx melampygus]|nr:hypothetical protein INR49_009730 [Caranx melampygus]